MARFTLTITIDDDSIETLDDLSSMMTSAWFDTTDPRITIEGTRANGGKVGFVANVDTSSYGAKALSV